MFSRLSKNHAPYEQISISSQRGRSSCLDVFCEKGSCNFIKKESLEQVFSCDFCKNFESTFFYRAPPVAASEQDPYDKV